MATDPIKDLQTLDLATGESVEKTSPSAIWRKANNKDKRFWFLEEVEQAGDALSMISDHSGQGYFLC